MIGVADADRRGELERLVEVDAARPGQLGAQHGGDQACRQHAVGDASAEAGRLGVGVVHVHGIDVAGQAGEVCHVGVGDRVAERGLLADRERIARDMIFVSSISSWTGGRIPASHVAASATASVTKPRTRLLNTSGFSQISTCPASGTTANSALGISWTMRSAYLRGLSTSFSPQMTSVGACDAVQLRRDVQVQERVE